MKKTTEKKLSLKKEVLADLQKVVGGVILSENQMGYSECETCNPR